MGQSDKVESSLKSIRANDPTPISAELAILVAAIAEDAARRETVYF